jgi:hypothetical protein
MLRVHYILESFELQGEQIDEENKPLASNRGFPK